MKQITVTIAVLILCLIPALLMAQEECTTQDCKKIIVVKSTTDMEDFENLKGELDEIQKMKIEITKDTNSIDDADSPDAPFFGIYPAELDFPKAQELNYPYSYGVLITGIVPNSPAYTYRLVEDDIIMEIGGKKAMNMKEFDKLKSQYRAGDAVVLSIFRAGEEKRIDFVFGSKEKKEITVSGHPGEKKVKKSLSPGYGGGTWVPMWYTADMKDVNELVKTIGFAQQLPEDGLLTQGLAFKGNVGKGWFIGGQFNFYNDSKKGNETVDGTNYTNSMDYNMFIGGATLDKRIPITKGIVTSLGVMIGGATHQVELVHSDGNYNWPVTTASPSLGTVGIMSSNSYANIHKGYVLVEPRAEVMVRLLSWLGLRGEIGYMYGYAPTSGWKVNHTDTESYEVKGSPDTPFNGMTFTVGPWFGF